MTWNPHKDLRTEKNVKKYPQCEKKPVNEQPVAFKCDKFSSSIQLARKSIYIQKKNI